MVQAVPQLMSFQEFLAWKPDSGRYELHDGVVVEMQPTVPHEQVVGLLNRKLNVLIDQNELDYFIPNTAMIQPLEYETGYKPPKKPPQRSQLVGRFCILTPQLCVGVV